MDLSFVISTQPTQFAAVTFSPDFEANVARLAELGYDGVELAVREPAALDLPAIRRVLDKYHLRVPAIGTGQAWGEEHLSFTDPDAGVRRRAVDRILSHVPLAAELDALIILGLIRGTVQKGVPADQAHAWLVSALREVTAAAGARNVRLVLEPINRYETNLLNNTRETLDLIAEVGGTTAGGAGNLGVLYDTFHSNIEEPQMEAGLQACGSRVLHVHLADSNRWAPGMGHLDFSRILATLREMNYRGWVSAEILPKPNIVRAQEQTITTIRSLL